MDLAGITAKANRGYGIAASKAGSVLAQYRPGSASAQLGGTPMAMVLGYFDQSKALRFDAAVAWGHPMAAAVLDATGLLPGDYLVAQADAALPALALDTWFVARLEPARPPLCVLCNAVLDVLTSDSAAQDAAVGAQAEFAEPASGADTMLASGWAASLLIKTRGDAPAAKLPTDTRAAFFEALMPAPIGVAIGPGLRLRDATGQTYHVATSERSDYGYRLLVATDSA